MDSYEVVRTGEDIYSAVKHELADRNKNSMGSKSSVVDKEYWHFGEGN